LRSYKEAGQDDEDEDEEDDFESSELETNCQDDGDTIGQMSFEMNDFNKMYSEEESLHPELSQSSAQWRIHGNNLNRPAGSAPLVPNEQARGHVKSRLDLRDESRVNEYTKQFSKSSTGSQRSDGPLWPDIQKSEDWQCW